VEVSWTGVCVAVLVLARPAHGDIRLWFPQVVQHDRVLDPDDDPLAEGCGQEPVQGLHAAAVCRADRRHLDDLPAEQLDPVVFGEDAGLGHPVVVLHREQAASEVSGHRRTS
jgi:hypothetical protein